MSSSLLERTRAYHEDIEQYEDACAELLLEEAKSYRDNLVQAHRVNQFAEKIVERYAKLQEIYNDSEGARKEELTRLEGDPSGSQLYSQFYEQLRDIKEYHRKFSNIENTKHEAQIMLKEGAESAKAFVSAQFSSEEGLGRYLDLHSHYLRFFNLKNIVDSPYQVDYMGFLHQLVDQGYVPVPGPTRKNPEYLEYLSDILSYFKGFMKRSLPLYDLETRLNETKSNFEKNWETTQFRPISMSKDTSNGRNNYSGNAEMDICEEDDHIDKDWVVPWLLNFEANADFYCACCSMKLSKETVWKAHLASPKHQKALQKYIVHVKEVSLLETELVALTELLKDSLTATIENIERKQARLPGEAAFMNRDDMDDDGEIEDEDDDPTQRTRMTKKNYPVGPDGNPLPYWLYRLQGLSHEFKCQICGNATYQGRRAFERHFADSRHTYGLRCLGLENSKDMYEITEIDKAIALGKKLKQLKTQGKWNPDTMEEFEDAEGTVLDKATYELLAKQFEM